MAERERNRMASFKNHGKTREEMRKKRTEVILATSIDWFRALCHRSIFKIFWILLYCQLLTSFHFPLLMSFHFPLFLAFRIGLSGASKTRPRWTTLQEKKHWCRRYLKRKRRNSSTSAEMWMSEWPDSDDSFIIHYALSTFFCRTLRHYCRGWRVSNPWTG